MLKMSYPYYLAGKAVAANTDLEVTNKYTGEVATRVARADRKAIDKAISAAARAAGPMRAMPAYKRQAVLLHLLSEIEARHEELSRALCIEAGKPLADSRVEVTRGIDTVRIAAEETVRLGGVYQPLDISPRAEHFQSIWKRVPLGPCSFITPFNFPINLALHKIAPALAVGCPFVLKPASSTPVGALLMGEILAGADLPRGAFSILPCKSSEAEALTTDERIMKLSFTGSAEVGWSLKAKCGKKHITLELGGNAACIVDHDADPNQAAARLAKGAFYQSGQSCISVQRIIVHDDIYDVLVDRLIKETRKLKMGDPLDEKTDLGPLITEGDARRVESWVEAAVAGGARVLVGGKRKGAFYQATLLENVDPKMEVSCKEVFGPVAVLYRFNDFKEACRMVNDSPFGLQAGVFTRDIHKAFYAWNELVVGGVVVNDVPSVRVDSMPYGGSKDSGLGREGIRFAMESMTEIRLLLLSNIGKL